jgi:hypothetical protein
MLSVKEEQRVNVKFLAKLGKSATETYSLLIEVNGDGRQSMHWKSHQEKKSTEEQVQFQNNDDLFFR